MRSSLFLLLAACVTTKPAPSPTVATATGFQVSAAELDAYIDAHPKLARQIYDLKHSALEELTLDRLVDQSAKKANLPSEVWLRGEVDKRVIAPSDAEVRAFFDTRVAPQAQSQNRDLRFEDIAPQIRDHLLSERRDEGIKQVLDGLRATAQLTILLPPARVQVPTTGPSRGPADAKVTIVEFSDYQCPYCSREEDALKQIVATYPTQVRLVVRDFPLDMHPYARGAARAAVCADAQQHFWQMHDAMLRNQGSLDEDSLKQTARSLGLDGPRFDACLESKETDLTVLESQRAGEAVGVDGTPALFLNGRPLAGAVGFADLKATVDEELKTPPVPPMPKGTP